jgi:hypothetical protein
VHSSSSTKGAGGGREVLVLYSRQHHSTYSTHSRIHSRIHSRVHSRVHSRIHSNVHAYL